MQGRPVDPDAPIHLGHRDQRLRVAFGLPTYLRYESTVYRTQLVGLEQVPQDWSSRAEREFTTLPAAGYTLRIWARDGLGRESPPAELTIVVTPPWWRTWWALGGALLALAALVAGLVWRRHRVLADKAMALEALVHERTRELAAANDALQHQSMTDPLTGVFNRRSLPQHIAVITNRLVRRYRRAPDAAADPNRDLGFLLLDMDHFKSVNDTWGHQAGDRVLRQAADVVRAAVREEDLVVRWGGEEFLIIALDTQAAELPVLAERVRERLANHRFDTGAGQPITRTASIGFVAMPLLADRPEAFNWEQLVSLADQGLYRAKASGRNRWVGLLPDPRADSRSAPPEADWDALVAAGYVRQVEGPPSPPASHEASAGD